MQFQPRLSEVITHCHPDRNWHLNLFWLSQHTRRQGIPLHLRRLDRLVAALPDNQRAICTWRCVEGWTLPRIADQVNITVDRIRW
ncbi:MAG: sigma factor-like helix-turn-helix DNA-binding protein [Gammaproteobacteria bacterium]